MTAALKPDALFLWEQEPPPEWRERLAALAPRNPRVPWLWLDWFSGEPQEPVQRWAIWEIKPRELVFDLIERDLAAAGIWNAKAKAKDYATAQHTSFTAGLWAAVNGPHPRTLGQWKPITRWKDGDHYTETVWDSDCLVTRDQWAIHKKTDGFPQLYWIVQGEKGGHKIMLSPRELKLLALAGVRNAELPTPGDLPYAPFDERVLTKLAERDRLRQWEQRFNTDWAGTFSTKERAGRVWGAEKKLAEEQSRRALQTWLKEQCEQGADALASVINISDLPRGDTHYDRDIDEVERRFIEGD